MGKVTIYRVEKTEDSKTLIKNKKHRFFRRRIYIDPISSTRYDRFETYDENKQDFYNTARLVYTGKCKNIYEAYALNH